MESWKLTLKNNMSHLKPDFFAADAVNIIYHELLHTIKYNEQGTINAADNEFLHNFRVAIRKTRVGLAQLKKVTPKNITYKYSNYFAWLGEITSTVRDLDVYILNFTHYKASIPLALREDLNPLYNFLKFKQSVAQQKLAKLLKSKKYLTPLIDWEKYLNQATTVNKVTKKLTVKQLADERIENMYQRVIKHGAMINDKSPPTALHDLRKTCKKLRYLIEFFQNLYAAEKIKRVLKPLKELQELLGDFQDCAVQEEMLKKISEEMRSNGCSEETFLAVAELVKVLDRKHCKARRDFTHCFSVFSAFENKLSFESLLTCKT